PRLRSRSGPEARQPDRGQGGRGAGGLCGISERVEVAKPFLIDSRHGVLVVGLWSLVIGPAILASTSSLQLGPKTHDQRPKTHTRPLQQSRKVMRLISGVPNAPTPAGH